MAKKQLEDDLLTGGSLNADDKSAKKAAKAKKSAEKKALDEYEALKDFYHVSPAIDHLKL